MLCLSKEIGLNHDIHSAQGKSKQQDSLLRQALVGNHLASSPAKSPAMLWTATPDAAQLESGKLLQVSDHGSKLRRLSCSAILLSEGLFSQWHTFKVMGIGMKPSAASHHP